MGHALTDSPFTLAYKGLQVVAFRETLGEQVVPFCRIEMEFAQPNATCLA